MRVIRNKSYPTNKSTTIITTATITAATTIDVMMLNTLLSKHTSKIYKNRISLKAIEIQIFLLPRQSSNNQINEGCANEQALRFFFKPSALLNIVLGPTDFAGFVCGIHSLTL